jgi:putative transposase
VGARYIWRQLSPEQRERLLTWRQENQRPWHSPPHRPNFGHVSFLVSAACYMHRPHIGFSPERMDVFAGELLAIVQQHGGSVAAWCVLPNHYHLLLESANILKLLHPLGRFHGRTSHQWNGEEDTRGRQVFCKATERFMRSERHFFTTLNYVHNNPVHHQYARLWTEWPWSSAAGYFDAAGRVEAERVWREYPIRDYGKKWDDAHL